jgi:hypothetical protein
MAPRSLSSSEGLSVWMSMGDERGEWERFSAEFSRPQSLCSTVRDGSRV